MYLSPYHAAWDLLHTQNKRHRCNRSSGSIKSSQDDESEIMFVSLVLWRRASGVAESNQTGNSLGVVPLYRRSFVPRCHFNPFGSDLLFIDRILHTHHAGLKTNTNTPSKKSCKNTNSRKPVQKNGQGIHISAESRGMWREFQRRTPCWGPVCFQNWG